MESDDLPEPQPEIAKDAAKLDVPAVPSFELVVTESGFHGPRELRVRGQPLLNTQVKVKGYITSIYDCIAEIGAANPGMTRSQIDKAIDKNPAICERPKLYLGDTRDTPRDASIWVVDVPQLPIGVERQRQTKDELKTWPGMPRIAVGDYVVVTGTWALTSPHAEHNTGGLLVFKELEHAVLTTKISRDGGVSEPEIIVATRPPMRKVVAPDTEDASIKRLNACNRAFSARQYDAVVTECEAALKIWEGNHRALYVLAGMYILKNDWQKTRAAIERAVAMRPDFGMYQMYYGMALYEIEVQRVRDELARKQNKKPGEVTVDPALLKLDAARDALRRAVKLLPDLWHAHYYLGRVYRDLGDSRHEAEQFTQAITTHPSYANSYIALLELYRQWDYLDQALTIARLGTANVPAAESGQLWYELGLVYDAKRDDTKAIDAFTRAIARNPNDLSSKFQRGQIYFHKGDYTNARADLQEVAKSSDPKVAATKVLASQMLSHMH